MLFEYPRYSLRSISNKKGSLKIYYKFNIMDRILLYFFLSLFI